MEAEARSAKPRYGMWSNTGFMLSIAWRVSRNVPFAVTAMAVCASGAAITELFIAPVILGRIESHASASGTMLAIAAFTAVLMALNGAHEYLDTCKVFDRTEVRDNLLWSIGRKTAGTSYINTLDPAFRAAERKCSDACNSNWAPTERFWSTWTEILTNVIGFAVYLAVLSGLDPRLIAVVIATAAASYLSGRRINEWGYRHREEGQTALKRFDYLNDLGAKREYAKDIRIFGLRPWILELRAGALRTLAAFHARRERTTMWANVIDVALTFARNGVAYAYLIWITLAQELSASQFLLYFTAISGFGMWVTGILDQFAELNKESLELSQIREFLDWPEPFAFEDGEPLQRRIGHAYQITLDHVSFRYPGAGVDTLTDVNLDIHAGERLAVVGLNGAGKTTLIKLVCGFLDPTAGRVLLDGEDIRRYDRRDYYELFAAVFQDFSVLDSTIAQNVAQRFDGIDRERVRACLHEAGLADAVDALPGGPDAHIGRAVYEDGVELSGGQTQRLMLARALYKDAPILLLDEPTAALDPIAENDIYLHYNRMTAGRTSVFISHRLASTRFCDRIIFLSDGRIAEQGTHESLLAAGGGYARLFAVQSKYYRDGVAGDTGGDADGTDAAEGGTL
ncbi:ABC transporter ATP-binding protein [Bifidobacterium avesanii]|uniref:ATP-binding cassette domain-containing protein n=1 Tax=Bifidobacterium avesanii TaxID=1798157 RepID=A0A7K3TIU7_9BIFI|nr:ABC transporter ATP-binding protein [Bifidobacterium avesanii]KAB8289923.1 ABC transporter permease [Bifidobacterium avesanii]NEG78836.1 ATP-binding cassette domain-containing protein [Bifidobacterium avesanii]